MKITKYTQSCLLIEDGNGRVLIDPSAAEKDHLDSMGKLDAVLFTHEHSDHFDADVAKLLASQGVKIYANASTAKLIDAELTEVSDGQEFVAGGIDIKALELPHCLMPDGSQGPQNTGYLISGRLFHPGDGKEIDGLSADILAVPIAGPDISIKDACDFLKQVSAKDAVPIHFDMMNARPDFFVRLAQRYQMPFNVHPLAHGENVEL